MWIHPRRLYADNATHETLVREFTRVYTRLGRVPTAAELQALGRHKLCEYIDFFGSWPEFVQRLGRVAEGYDLTRLALPKSIDEGDLMSFADRLTDDEGAFIEEAASAVESARRLEDAFWHLARQYEGRNAEGDFKKDLLKLQRASEESLDRVTRISLALGSSIHAPTPPDARQDTNDESATSSVVSNFSRFSSYGGVVRFVRSASKQLQSVQALAEAVDAFRVRRLPELEALQGLLSATIQCSRLACETETIAVSVASELRARTPAARKRRLSLSIQQEGSKRRAPDSEVEDLRRALVKAYRSGERHFADQELVGVHLDDINLEKVRLVDSDLSDATLRGANLHAAVLDRSLFVGADLTDADLANSRLAGSKLSQSRLTRAILENADAPSADLRGACLVDADLSGANLRGAKLIKADLRGAILVDTNLSGADLCEAKLDGATYSRGTKFPAGVDPGSLEMILDELQSD